MYKSILFCILLFLVSAISLSSQHICGGVIGDHSIFNDRLRANIKQAKLTKHLKSQETVYIPIMFHLVANSDGIGRVNFSDILDEMCTLNSQFDSLGIKFYFADGVNEVNHTPTYEDPRKAGSIGRILSEIEKVGQNAVNVIITQNADLSSNPDFGRTLGFYSNVNDYVVVRKNEIGRGGSTMVHELGHLFSLNHPHLGWEDQPWNIEVHGKRVNTRTVSSSQSSGSIRVELVDRSNCEEAGDMLCDTPPDYNFGFSFDRDCPRFRTVVLDRNGDTIVPMQNNYMSYFLGCDPYAFTQQQVDVIIADVNSSKRSNLRTGYTPTDATISEIVTLESPSNSATTDFFNGVELVWSEVQNADSYYLNIAGGTDDFRIITDQPIYFMQDLKPNTTYRWSVTPFNETGGCGETKTNILSTNDVETATVESAIEGSITISPNPSFESDQLRVHVNSEESISGYYFISTITGKKIDHQPINITQGANILELNMSTRSPGVYLFSISTEKGISTKRFIIQ